jgi:hypothetical protein
LLIHFVSVGRLLLLQYNAILLFVGTGDPAIGFGRLEVFLCGMLLAHELGGEGTVMANVTEKLDRGMERRDRM